MTDPIAQLRIALSERYSVERTLGQGGMATVYLARDLKHDRPVALKVLRPELAAALGAERFLREIRITAGLTHPHILPLLDSGEAGGSLYYVMPYVEGESLRDRLTRERQLPLDDALQIAREVADALGYAHSRDLMHRDIKPENILLVAGHAVVADFGIARAITAAGGERLTATGLAVGTPAYMSPEQAFGGPDVDGRTDVYALGCVLYELLTGEPPYTGPTAQAIMAKHLSEPAPPARRLRDAVPEHVEQALRRALAKVRADRFATAHRFAEALGAPGATSATGRMPARRRLAVAVGVVLVVLGGLEFSGARQAVTRRLGFGLAVAGAQRSVAVLPFENVGGDSAEEYFSDGLTEELIAALSQVRALRVAARQSAFAFKGQARDIREIARALDVGFVLVGSVRKASDRVRVTAQLVDASSGLHLWSATYDERALADIFDIQADVALRIAQALEANLSAAERGRIARKPTESLEAHNLYLKGRYSWGRRGRGLVTAIEYFQRAIAVDSLYARAYAGLASVYLPLGVHGHIHPRVGREAARAAALRAVELDPELGDAHTVLAAYWHVYEWDWAAAEREFRRAIELEPNNPIAHTWYGYFLQAMGRWDEAIAERGRAAEVDPLDPAPGLPSTLRMVGQYDRARRLYQNALELDAESWQLHYGLGQVHAAIGRLPDAVAALRRAVELGNRSPIPQAALASVLAVSGGEPEARRILQELRARAAESGIMHPAVADPLFHLEGADAALFWLEAAYQQRHPALVELGMDPKFAPLRRDPRFQDLVRRIGLPS